MLPFNTVTLILSKLMIYVELEFVTLRRALNNIKIWADNAKLLLKTNNTSTLLICKTSSQYIVLSLSRD